MSLKSKLEAVIYAAEEPVTLAQLAAIFADEVLPATEPDAVQIPLNGLEPVPALDDPAHKLNPSEPTAAEPDVLQESAPPAAEPEKADPEKQETPATEP